MVEVILALDTPDGATARRLLDQLPQLRWVKLGSVLVTREGPALVRDCTARGLRVFLDLKWHDIPNTVVGAVRAAAEQGVAMATVHCLGGAAMLRAAQAEAGRTALALVGVTVLTSHDAPDYADAVGRTDVALDLEAERLARMAQGAGLAGVVCAAHEAARARALLGASGHVVVPGIRRPGDGAGDQRRTATPRDARAAGATHLVVGRPILTAADPAAALAAILDDLA